MSDCVPVAHFFSWKYISVIHRFLDSLIQMIVHIITDDQIWELCDFKTFLFYLTFSDKHHGRTSRRNPRLYNKVHAPAPALCSHRNHDRRLAYAPDFYN